MRCVFGYLNESADVDGCLQVIVVEDENGNIVRETMKDNDVLQQYKTMRETLVGAAAVLQQCTTVVSAGRAAPGGVRSVGECWLLGSDVGDETQERRRHALSIIFPLFPPPFPSVQVYLCHLDYEDTEVQMLEKLRQQVGVGRVTVWQSVEGFRV